MACGMQKEDKRKDMSGIDRYGHGYGYEARLEGQGSHA